MVRHSQAPGRPHLSSRSSCLPILPQLFQGGRSLSHCTPGKRCSSQKLLIPVCTAARPNCTLGCRVLFSRLSLIHSKKVLEGGKYSRKAFPTVVKCSLPWYLGPTSGLAWLGGEWCRLAAGAASAHSGRVGGSSLSARGQLWEARGRGCGRTRRWSP